MDNIPKSMTANESRYVKLHQERIQEIKRDGVAVFINISKYQQEPYFTFQETDYSKLQELIGQEKFSLQFCQQNGTPLFQFTTENAILQPSTFKQPAKLFIASVTDQTEIEPYRRYYIAKKNTSISVHKTMLSNLRQDQDILKSSSTLIKKFIQEKISTIDTQVQFAFPNQPDLNEMQNMAISKVGKNALTFIKGPPGCGKTRTISRICKLFYHQKQKVILGTVSNTGNISILNELIKQMNTEQQHNLIHDLSYCMSRNQFNIEETINHCSEYIKPKIVLFTNLQTLHENNQLDEIRKYYSINQWLIRNIIKINFSKDLSVKEIENGLQLIAQKKVQSFGFYKKIYSLYRQALKKTIEEADILITTTVLSASIQEKVGGKQNFEPHIAILDEASQATWADTLCYLYYNVERFVLVGDEKQLDPTVISQDKLLKQTVFSKLSQKNPQYFVMLDIQYRMHPAICQFPNIFFYGSQLKNGVTQKERTSNVYYCFDHPVSFLSHREVQQFNEQGDYGKKNYHNKFQRQCIADLLSLFPREQLKNVGIISPYSLQVKLLCEQFYQQMWQYDLTIKTCDGYQGGEKDYIIFTCVRSNNLGKIGFCGQKNRINVSLTRAKKSLIIIGNTQTLSTDTETKPEDNVWASLISYLQSKNKIFEAKHIIDEINYHNNLMYYAYNNPSSLKDKQIQSYSMTASEQRIPKNGNQSSEPNNTVHDSQQEAFTKTPTKTSTAKSSLLEQFQKEAALIKDIQEDEQSDLISRNKKQVKQIRKIITKSDKDLNTSFVSQVSQLFQKNTSRQTLKLKLTKSLYGEFLDLLKSNRLLNPSQQLKVLLQNLNKDLYKTNHIYQADQTYRVIRIGLLHQMINLFS